MIPTTCRARAAAGTPRGWPRSKEKRGQPLPTTSYKPWRSPSKGRSISVYKIGWSSRRNLVSRIRKSKLGIRIEGELLVILYLMLNHIERSKRMVVFTHEYYPEKDRHRNNAPPLSLTINVKRKGINV